MSNVKTTQAEVKINYKHVEFTVNGFNYHYSAGKAFQRVEDQYTLVANVLQKNEHAYVAESVVSEGMFVGATPFEAVIELIKSFYA